MTSSPRLTTLLIALTLAVSLAKAVEPWTVDDLDILCESARLLDAGENPYDYDVLTRVRDELPPLTNPPMVPRLLQPACGYPTPVPGTVFAILTVLVLWRGLRLPLGVTIVSIGAGLAGFPVIAAVGNAVMIEGLTMAVACVGLRRDRPLLFGAAIGAAAFLKSLTPLAMLAGIVRWSPRRAFAAAAMTLAVLAGLHGLEFAVDPAAALNYWHAYRHEFRLYAFEELVGAKQSHPSPLSFLLVIARHFDVGAVPAVAGAAVIALAFGAAWLRLWLRSSREGFERVWLAMLAMAIMVTVFPRMKPYTTFMLTPIVAVGVSRLSGGPRRRAIALACLLPCALLWISEDFVAGVAYGSLRFVLEYTHWFALALVVALALRRPVFERMVAHDAP